jgi:hypothetical protein
MVELSLDGEPGRSYIIEATTDFTAWTTVTNIVLGQSPGAISDSTTASDVRFFRAADATP